MRKTPHPVAKTRSLRYHLHDTTSKPMEWNHRYRTDIIFSCRMPMKSPKPSAIDNARILNHWQNEE